MDPHAIGTVSTSDRPSSVQAQVRPPFPSLRWTHQPRREADRALPSRQYPALATTSDHAILYILATPTESLYQYPISMLAVRDVVRAWPGSTCGHKLGGNYSPGFLYLREAVAQGYDHILWLFGKENRMTEGGAMNIFVVLKRADGSGACFVFAHGF